MPRSERGDDEVESATDKDAERTIETEGKTDKMWTTAGYNKGDGTESGIRGGKQRDGQGKACRAGSD